MNKKNNQSTVTVIKKEVGPGVTEYFHLCPGMDETTYNDYLRWAQSLTSDQINFLCDNGSYNNAIRGYMIAAGKIAGFADEDINALLLALFFALDRCTKVDAENICSEWDK